MRKTGRVTLTQEHPNADDVAFGMLLAVQTDLGQQIVPSGICALSLEFDHIGRPGVSIRLKDSV